MQTLDLEKFPDTVCACDSCKRVCSHNRPCWGTPQDIKKIMQAGHADKLMLDWYGHDKNEDRDILIVAPAITGNGGKSAPLLPQGRCAMLNDAGLCTLHDSGLKPTEGRKVLCSQDKEEARKIHMGIVALWDTEEGQSVVAAWREAVDCETKPGPENYDIGDYLGMMFGMLSDFK